MLRARILLSRPTPAAAILSVATMASLEPTARNDPDLYLDVAEIIVDHCG